MTLDTDKFEEFERLISSAKDKHDMDAVIVKSPQVLGDTYEELVANLDKLASAELAVVIVPPPDRARPMPGGTDPHGRTSRWRVLLRCARVSRADPNLRRTPDTQRYRGFDR